jgi:hypothetical protein
LAMPKSTKEWVKMEAPRPSGLLALVDEAKTRIGTALSSAGEGLVRGACLCARTIDR